MNVFAQLARHAPRARDYRHEDEEFENIEKI